MIIPVAIKKLKLYHNICLFSKQWLKAYIFLENLQPALGNLFYTLIERDGKTYYSQCG